MELDWMGCLKEITGMNEEQERLCQHGAFGVVPHADQTLFARKKPGSVTPALKPAHTLRLKSEPIEAALSEPPSHAASPRPLSWYGVTDTGKVREHNEDNFSLLTLGDKSLFVVADGMGGHDAGEVASRIAMETVCGVVQKENTETHDLLKLVERAVQQANIDVQREGACTGSNMGTTLSVVLVADDAAYIANVGDSRVYWIENGSIVQVTTDHSLVAKLVAAGKLTKENARNHPRSNLLYRTIGNDETVIVDTFRIGLKKGGTLLLCTDGLWGEVADEDILRVSATEAGAKAAGDRLVQMANEHGGKDNITAVVVKVL
ncbi:MAG: Stp1/IreP family PP2C-type Ser/Thr phosphatase [Betaproteobacteria bacterium]